MSTSNVQQAVPRWVRILLAVDTVVTKAMLTHEALRNAVLFAFVDPSDRAAITHFGYAEPSRFYTPEHRFFEAGLFGWEKAAFKVMGIGPGTSVLLGAAGGGRELRALVAMGCRVLAFEPDRALANVARRLVEGVSSASVHYASYAELVEQAASGQGPIVEFARAARAVILGWGSFPHLTLDSERTALLSTLRSVAPGASVLLSFPLRTGTDFEMSSMQLRLARALELIGGRPPVPGLTYIRRRGFMQRFMPDEIRDLAERTGYRVEVLDHSPYGHAVLMPRAET